MLQDEPSYRFDEKGYKVPIEPADPPPPPSKSKTKPPLAPKTTTAAVVSALVASAEQPIAALDRELPPPDGTVQGVSKNPPQRKQIQWNDQRDELLLDYVVEFNALENKKMGERFQQIAVELFKLEPFKAFSVVKGDTFQKRFTDMKKDALMRWGISQEGANLSGLLEFNSSALKGWEQKLYAILLKQETSARGPAITTAKGLQREISMLVHEKEVIQKQLKGLQY